jgi:uncharacterized protein YdiU (UPF0061 family)
MNIVIVLKKKHSIYKLNRKNFQHYCDEILERFQGVFKFHDRQQLRARFGVQIWFSVINFLALYHCLRCCLATTKMSYNFTFLGVPTPAGSGEQKTENALGLLS